MLEDLLERNKNWAATHKGSYFENLAVAQHPEYLWIGCSDSRVPANVVAGLEPGEVFVHCNVANVVHFSDLNILTALEFAVDTLKVREIIVCGHHGCGGVKAATEDLPHGLADHWLEPIRMLERQHQALLEQCNNELDRRDLLAELNVIEGVRRVSETPILQRAWERGRKIKVHGLIYDLDNGHLRDLGCTVDGLQTGAEG